MIEHNLNFLVIHLVVHNCIDKHSHAVLGQNLPNKL